MRGGSPIYRRVHAAWGCVMCVPRGNLIYHMSPSTDLSWFASLYSFLIQFFKAAFGGLLVLKMGHARPLESLRSLLSNDIKFAWIGVRTEKLWLLEVGSSKLFFHVFPTKIPAKWEMPSANQELSLVAGVVVFLKVPSSQSNHNKLEGICARRRLFGRKNA